MKVRIKSEGRNFRFWIPTGMIFSKTSAKIANALGRRYAPEAMDWISPQALEMLCAELGSVKKRYGKWELIKVESPNGNIVEITL